MAARRLHPLLRLLAVCAAVLLVGACGSGSQPWAVWNGASRESLTYFFTTLLAPRPSIEQLLARPPASGKALEVDAYFSGAIVPPPEGADSAGCDVDPHAILSDKPFLPDLAVLGGTQSNSLSERAAWLVVALPDGVAPSSLPYHARFRGHLGAPPGVAGCPAAGRVFFVDKVIRTYAARPPAASDPAVKPANWRRHQDVGAGYSVPQPPGWRVEQPDSATLTLRDPRWPESPVIVRVYPGETHDDPYDPAAAPRLAGQNWSLFEQATARAGQAADSPGLSGYRLERSQSGERTLAVLFSGHGKTYDLSVRFPLGLDAPQPVLTAYTAMVAGFSLNTPPGPTPTPPVRQALGPGPFLSAKQALAATCGRLDQQVETFGAELVSEAQARTLGARCARFMGHYDGVWVLTVRTPRASSTQAMRLFYDAATGRELCSEEIEAAGLPPTEARDAPTPEALTGRPQEATDIRARRWIEVILSKQMLVAWEGDTPVRRMLIASGMAEYPTVTGSFHIYMKLLSMRMTGPGYDLPNVPHVMLFHESYALHGAYWRDVFGTPGSHGCVNLSLSDAAWLFDWTNPQLPPGEWGIESTLCNPGTLVVVHE